MRREGRLELPGLGGGGRESERETEREGGSHAVDGEMSRCAARCTRQVGGWGGREGGSSSEAVTADSLIDDPAEDRISFIQRFIRITS